MDPADAGPLEVTDDITVRIEHADFGDSKSGNCLCRRASLNRASGRNTEGACGP